MRLFDSCPPPPSDAFCFIWHPIPDEVEIMSPLGMARIDSLNHLECVGDVAKANVGPMNEDQQKTDKAT